MLGDARADIAFSAQYAAHGQAEFFKARILDAIAVRP
jgi:hypothetical protein